MKLAGLLIVLILFPFIAFTQGILAGDTLSPGIVYVDIPDEIIAASYPQGSDGFTIDLDGDGTDDIAFSSTKSSSMAHTSEKTKCLPAQYYNGEIIASEQNIDWVEPIQINTMIGPASNWQDCDLLKSETSINGSTTYAGVFTNGYIGFKYQINGNQIYAWIKAQASSSHIKVMSYAYTDISTSKSEYNQDKLCIFPNPVTDHLYLDHLSSEIPSPNFTIYDISGRPVSEGLIEDFDHSIDCSGVANGVYFLQIEDSATETKTFKFIKK